MVIHQVGNGETWRSLNGNFYFSRKTIFLWLLSEHNSIMAEREKSYFEWFFKRLFRVNCCSSTWHDLTMFMNMEIQFMYTDSWRRRKIENLFMLVWLMMFFFCPIAWIGLISRHNCVIIFHFMYTHVIRHPKIEVHTSGWQLNYNKSTEERLLTRKKSQEKMCISKINFVVNFPSSHIDFFNLQHRTSLSNFI